MLRTINVLFETILFIQYYNQSGGTMDIAQMHFVQLNTINLHYIHTH